MMVKTGFSLVSCHCSWRHVGTELRRWHCHSQKGPVINDLKGYAAIFRGHEKLAGSVPVWKQTLREARRSKKLGGLCPECSFKLNFHHKRKEVKAKIKTKRLSEENQEPSQKKKKRKRSSSKSKKHKNKHKRHRDCSASSSSSDESQDSDKDSEAGEKPDDLSEADHWRGPAPAVEEKSREEEFDEYFEDMFL